VGSAAPFMVCTHRAGDSHVLPVYVRAFLEAMITLELFE
jgi:hypothetical protein